jgi:hypothetical protein
MRFLSLKATIYKPKQIFFRRIQEIIKKLEKEDPAHSYVLYYKDVNYEKTSAIKYSYGNAYIKKVPLNHAASLFMTMSQNLHQLHVDNLRLSPMTTEVPIGSNFAQVCDMLDICDFCIAFNFSRTKCD